MFAAGRGFSVRQTDKIGKYFLLILPEEREAQRQDFVVVAEIVDTLASRLEGRRSL